MVKKMSQLQSNTSNNDNNDSVHLPNLIKTHPIQKNHQRIQAEKPIHTKSQLQSANIIDRDLNQPHQQTPQLGSFLQQKTNIHKQIPSYRLISYPISNKQYRLIQSEDNDEDRPIYNQYYDGGINNNINEDFRQPQNQRYNVGGDNNVNPNLARLPPQRHNYLRRLHLSWLRQRPNYNRQRKSYSNSIFSYLKKLFKFVKSVQLSSLCEYIPFYPHSQTLQSKYKYISQAILNNSINLESSVIKALQYNIPLMQIIINPKNIKQEQIVLEKILKSFNVAHFINQNFVLYGDWEYEKYKKVFQTNFLNRKNSLDNKNKQEVPGEYGKIVFRKGEMVFAEIDLLQIDKLDVNELQEKLLQIRDQYYKKRQQSLILVTQSRISSNVSSQNPNSSMIQSHKSSIYNPDQRKTQMKTVQQIRQQILQDYLIQRREEQHKKLLRKQQQELNDQNFNGVGFQYQMEYDYDSSDYDSNSPFSTPQKKKNNAQVQSFKKKNSPSYEKQLQMKQKTQRQSKEIQQKYEQKQKNEEQKAQQKEEEGQEKSYIRHWRNM